MDLDEAGVISLDMIGRSIFLQQQRQLVVQHHFPPRVYSVGEHTF